MAALRTYSVDAVVTDPPYGERAATWDAPRSFSWHHEWIAEANRVLRPGAPLVVFCSRAAVDVVMGAGVVARQLGRRFIGFDNSAAYLFGLARPRLTA